MQPNTPANGHWEMKLSSSQIGAITEVNSYITFSVNGSIDTNRTLQADLDRANSFLALAILNLHVQLTAIPFDFWELINWLYVSYCWIVLGRQHRLFTLTMVQAFNLRLKTISS